MRSPMRDVFSIRASPSFCAPFGSARASPAWSYPNVVSLYVPLLSVVGWLAALVASTGGYEGLLMPPLHVLNALFCGPCVCLLRRFRLKLVLQVCCGGRGSLTSDATSVQLLADRCGRT